MSDKTISKLPPLLKRKTKKGDFQFVDAGRTNGKACHKVGSAFVRTEAQAAEWLGVSISTLRRIRKRGEIGHYQISKNYHYDIQHLEAYLKSKEQCPKNASKSANTTSSNIQILPSTKPDGSTVALDKHAAHLLAQKTFMKPKKLLQSTP